MELLIAIALTTFFTASLASGYIVYTMLAEVLNFDNELKDATGKN